MNAGSRIWMAANAVMLALFVFAAAVQYNDPDPVVWMAIYLVAAVVCGIEVRRRTPRWLPVVVAAIALLWAGWIGLRASSLAPIASLFAQWEMRDIHVEETREMYGLVIVAVWMLAVAIAAARGRRLTLPPAAPPSDRS